MMPTLTTIRMYIDRKQWHIPEIAVNVNMYHEMVKEEKITVIDRDLVFLSEVEEEQKTRLVEISAV